MLAVSTVFNIREQGSRTLVDFEDWQQSKRIFQQAGEDHHFVHECHRELQDRLKNYGNNVLAFNLETISVLPSSFLSLLVWLRNDGARIVLINPSEAVLHTLRITNLDRLFAIQHTS